MSVGGPTVGTAGPLTIGGSNTFDVADATYAGGTTPFSRGWWTITPTVPMLISLNVSDSEWVGPAFHLRQEVWQDITTDDVDGTRLAFTNLLTSTLTFTALAGVTYHILVGTFAPEVDDTVVTRYHLTATAVSGAHTSWRTTFQDRDDNVLITSFGDLALDNWPEFVGLSDDMWPGLTGPGRLGDYLIQETLPGRANGHLAIDAAPCAWSHALWGDIDSQLWNTSTTDPVDGGTPVCRPLIDGAADAVGGLGVNYSLSHSAGAPLISGSADAKIRMSGRGLWLKQILTELIAHSPTNHQRGVLPMSLAVPGDDGVPLDYIGPAFIEWEEPTVSFETFEVTGDIDSRPAADTVAEGNGIVFFLNDKLGPFHVGGEFVDAWQKGLPGEWTEEVGHPHRMIDYDDGDPVWTELDEFTGLDWDDLRDYDAGDPPDVPYGACMSIVFTGMPDLNTSAGNNSDLAVRVTLRSPRYRWVYFPTHAPAPRRVIQRRKDGLVGSGERTRGRSSAERTIGRQL